MVTERDKFIENKGGNAATISDMGRLMEYLIEKYGAYNDCDVKIDFSKAPDFIEVEAPVIMACAGGDLSSNDFIAFATDKTTNLLCADAKKRLHIAQEELLKRASDWKYLFNKMMSVVMLIGDHNLELQLMNLKKDVSNSKSPIYDFRMACEKFNYDSLYHISVIFVTGANVHCYLLYDDNCSNEKSLTAAKKIDPYVISKGHTKKSDLSWQKAGALAIKEREQKMEDAAIKIQKKWHQYRESQITDLYQELPFADCDKDQFSNISEKGDMENLCITMI